MYKIIHECILYSIIDILNTIDYGYVGHHLIGVPECILYLVTDLLLNIVDSDYLGSHLIAAKWQAQNQKVSLTLFLIIGTDALSGQIMLEPMCSS